MLQWFLELFQGFSDFIKRVLKFSGHCVFIAFAIGAVNSIPLDYFLKIGLTEEDAIAYIRVIKGFGISSIPLRGLQLSGILKMPTSPKYGTDDEEPDEEE